MTIRPPRGVRGASLRGQHRHVKRALQVIRLLSVGHYPSKRFGIRALREHLAARLVLTHEFIDIPNPV